MADFYALIVGIDKYPNPRHELFGCVNDANAYESYLKERFSNGGQNCHVKVLRDGEAKREAVIEAFRSHFAPAGATDSAAFFYAGHGSQEDAPPEFWHIEPDRKNETLVCWDSRIDGGHDLADKEISKLLEEVAGRVRHLAVVLDCCHSGSGTRAPLDDAAERRIPPDKRPRPFSSYLPESQQAAAGLTRGSLTETGWVVTGSARHVLLAACRDDQTAKEYSPEGERHGALTYFLLKTLAGSHASLSYRELIQQVTASVSASVADQDPQLEATRDADLDQPFLGGDAKLRQPFFTASFKDGSWMLNGGSLHGIPQPSGSERVRLALFPLDTASEDISKPTKAVAFAQTTKVGAGSSSLEIADATKLQSDKVYKATITALPMPRLPIRLDGEQAAIELMRAALAQSLYVVEETGSGALFRILGKNGQFTVTRPASERPLIAPLSLNSSDAQALVSAVEQIARWNTMCALENPLTRLPREKITLSLLKDANGDEAYTEPELRLEYKRAATGKWVEPKFWIRVHNSGDRPVYCSILVLSELFGILTTLLPEGTRMLNPGEELWALDGKPVVAFVAKTLQSIGVTESRDVVKLLVSDTPFDARLLSEPELEGPREALTRGTTSRSVNTASTLNRLLSRLQTRGLGASPEQDENISDFFTRSISITTVRPRDAAVISGIEKTDLGRGISLQPHPTLKAKARLTTLAQSRRDLGNLALPALFREDREEDSPETLTFSASRGTDPGLSVLELLPSDTTINFETVTPDRPLRVRLGVRPEEDTEILPFAFDGEFYIPLGRAASEDGQAVVELHRLPAPVAEGERSLSGSIKILFEKLIISRLGFPYKYPLLAVAEAAPGGKVQYDLDRESVKRQVAASQRILLCVHGIIGDTEAIAAALKAAESADLVLTFDYENLNTTIEENAALLKSKLEDVGLGPNHGKTLQIVAHSMGGLVSRWFIERLDGNQIVQHLVMLGTPNAGSPWPTVEAYTTAFTALALNGLAGLAWPAKALGWFLNTAHHVNKALAEMRATSQLLADLAAAQDPGIRYTILAGNTALIHQEPSGSDQPLYKYLSRNNSVAELMHRVLSLAFFNDPNDMAVSVASCTAVKTDRHPQAEIQKISCDHITYFSQPHSVQQLWSALGLARVSNRAHG